MSMVKYYLNLCKETMKHIKISHDILEKIEKDELTPVLIESPLASSDIEGWVRNKKFARACLRECLAKGEAPYASHLLYAQEGLLNDDIPEERALGIHAGLVWGAFALKTVVYTDLGISSGMERGIKRAKEQNREIEYRTLGFVPQVYPLEVELEIKRRQVETMLENEYMILPSQIRPSIK